MPRNGVGFREVYSLVDDRTNQIMAKFDGLEKRVSALESLKTQALLLASFAGAVVSLSLDWIRKKIGAT